MGWIKIHRKITEWEWYTDTNVFRVFTHLLLTVNFKDKKWRGKTIKRGSKITSLTHLSEETGLTVMQVRTALDKLIVTGEVTKSSTSTYSLIKVNNYDEYQCDNKVDNKPITNEQQTSNKPITTTKESKKGKKEKNTDIEFEEFWSSYPRKLGKKKARDKYLIIDKSKHLQIMKALTVHIKNWDDPKFIPHPTTWLNGERWEDESSAFNFDDMDDIQLAEYIRTNPLAQEQAKRERPHAFQIFNYL